MLRLMTRGSIRGLLSAWYDHSDIFRADPFISACAKNRTPETRGFAQDSAFYSFFLVLVGTIRLPFGEFKWAVEFFQEQHLCDKSLGLGAVHRLLREEKGNPSRLPLAES